MSQTCKCFINFRGRGQVSVVSAILYPTLNVIDNPNSTKIVFFFFTRVAADPLTPPKSALLSIIKDMEILPLTRFHNIKIYSFCSNAYYYLYQSNNINNLLKMYCYTSSQVMCLF